MPRWLVLGLAIALYGCAPGVELVRPTGERVEPPIGWVFYCARHPEDPSCPTR